MPRMLDVSDAVRAEIGDEEADRLIAGENAPGRYECTLCRTPGSSEQEPTSTVLFVGGESTMLAFAHAACIPSQVVPVSEEQLQSAVRSITGDPGDPGGAAGAGSQAAPEAASGDAPAVPAPALGGLPVQRQAVLGVTSGLVLTGDTLQPALVVEPTGPVARRGSDGGGDEFLPLLLEHGFRPVSDVDQTPAALPGWSVLLATGRLHAVLQPGSGGTPTAWWQAHQPLPVTDGWRTAAGAAHTVLVFAAPAGAIGPQPREDLLREALDRAAADGLLVAASMRLTGS